MKSKAAVFACLLLFVSAVVIAEGNQEQQPEKVEAAAKENPVEESKQRCHYGCCHYYGYRCARCCGSVAEAQANTNANNNNNAQKEREAEATPNRWIGGGGHGGWRGGGGGHGGWRGGGGRGGGGK